MLDQGGQSLISSNKQYRNGILFDVDQLQFSGDVGILNNQQEKPSHYKYLKEFRVDPCPLFKQHQCTNHRPYSCFYWHFANQRRRKPNRRKDGTFNYSADFYCSKYDENTGVCPDGDDCPYLHRVYGDVERKYHLRYYKTALCVHPTDAKGHCSKNGAHCAFAHGPDDIRNPIFDIRELQHVGELNSETIDNRDRLNFVVEDPIWNDQIYVLINYKTEPCKKPPRLCRQGYACPYYHNGKDKRRRPQLSSPTNVDSPVESCEESIVDDGRNAIDVSNGIKYRSTPCPNVKRIDEWGDPDICETGEHCPYCHTRTEQQFHPEIYKSTKCNDMLQHGYCPRGPFCAFAHNENELQGDRRQSTSSTTKQRPSFSLPSPNSPPGPPIGCRSVQPPLDPIKVSNMDSPLGKSSLDQSNTRVYGLETIGLIGHDQNTDAAKGPSYSSVLKHRNHSGSTNGTGSTSLSSEASSASSPPFIYSKAPGFEREQHSPPRPWPRSSLDGLTAFPDSIFDTSKLSKTSLFLNHGTAFEMNGANTNHPSDNNSNDYHHHPHQQPLHTQVPTTPPTPNSMRGSVGSFSPFGGSSSTSSGQSLWHLHHRQNSSDEEGSDEYGLPTINERDENNRASLLEADYFRLFPNVHGHDQMSGDRTHAAKIAGQRHSLPDSVLQFLGIDEKGGSTNCNDLTTTSSLIAELRRANEELTKMRSKLIMYEELVEKAHQACENWKREAFENKYRAQVAEQERVRVEAEKEKIASQFSILTNELNSMQMSGLWPLHVEALSNARLEQIRSRLASNLEKIEKQLHKVSISST